MCKVCVVNVELKDMHPVGCIFPKTIMDLKLMSLLCNSILGNDTKEMAHKKIHEQCI